MTNALDRKVKWDFATVKAAAKRYKTRGDFLKKESGAYAAAHRRGWLEEVCSHMPRREKKPQKNTRWTRDTIIAEARKYGSLRDFRVGCRSAYVTASKLELLSEVKKVWTA